MNSCWEFKLTLILEKFCNISHIFKLYLPFALSVPLLVLIQMFIYKYAPVCSRILAVITNWK